MDDRAMNNEPLDLIAVEAVGIPMPRAGENAVPGQLPPDPTGLDDLLGSDLGAYDATGLSGVDADVDADTSMDDQIDTELGAQTLTSRGWTRWDRRDWPNGYRGPGYTSRGSDGVTWAIMPAPRRGWGLSMLNRQGFTASMGPFKSPLAAVEARRAFLAAGGHKRLAAAGRYTPASDVLGADYGAKETTMYGNLDDALGGNDASDFGARGTLTVGTSGTKAPRNGVKVFSFRARTVKNARQAVRAALRKFGRLRTVRAALASGVSLAVHAQIIAVGDGSFAVRFYVTKQKAAKLRDIKRQGAAVRQRDQRPQPRKASPPAGPAAQAWAVEESEAAMYDDTGLPALPDEAPPSGGASYSQEQVQAMTRADQPSAADAALAQILMDEEAAEADDFMLSDEGPEGMAGELGARRRRRPRKRRPGQRRPLSAAERRKILCSRCRRLACDPEPVASALAANEEIETVALGAPISPAQALALEYGHIRAVKPSRDGKGRRIVLVTFDVDNGANVPASVAGAGFGAAQERIIALPVFGDSIHPVLAELGGCPCKGWR